MLELGWTTLVQIFNFLILLYLLKFLLFQPMLKMMQERKAKVASDLAEAERLNAEALELKAGYEAKLRTAESEAKAASDKIMQETERLRQEKLRQAQEETEKMKALALTELNQEKNKVAAQLRQEAGALAVLLVEKVLAKVMDAQAHRSLIKNFIARVGEEDVA
jgi:F-type H+-transporting ATPase subunit b